VPDLDFRVLSASATEYAAVPSLSFTLGIRNRQPEPVRSITLNAQVRIAAHRRAYSETERERLREVFGEAAGWGASVKSLLWALTTLVVPAFTGETTVEMRVPCTYDFEVWSAKYLHLLESGEVPLEFLFSGTVFYEAGTGQLQAAQIPWETEAGFRMPVQVWKEMMEHYFPNSAWLRVRKDVFDRLYDFRTARSLPTWDAALDVLMANCSEKVTQ